MGSVDSIIYPRFDFIEERGWLPNVHLPRDYKDRIPVYYQCGLDGDLEDYSLVVKNEFYDWGNIRLKWDDVHGLVSIDFRGKGFDLDRSGIPSFQEHNLDGDVGRAAGAIATKYFFDLLKCEPE